MGVGVIVGVAVGAGVYVVVGVGVNVGGSCAVLTTCGFVSSGFTLVGGGAALQPVKAMVAAAAIKAMGLNKLLTNPFI